MHLVDTFFLPEKITSDIFSKDFDVVSLNKFITLSSTRWTSAWSPEQEDKQPSSIFDTVSKQCSSFSVGEQKGTTCKDGSEVWLHWEIMLCATFKIPFFSEFGYRHTLLLQMAKKTISHNFGPIFKKVVLTFLAKMAKKPTCFWLWSDFKVPNLYWTVLERKTPNKKKSWNNIPTFSPLLIAQGMQPHLFCTLAKYLLPTHWS